MQLTAVKVNQDHFEKLDFTFAHEGREVTITLAEKSDWPVILNQPLRKVERWFVRNYGTLITLLHMAGKI